MNTSHDWIKLHRQLLRHPLWEASTAEQKVLLVTLLMMANHAEKKWEFNGRPYHCRPGQMITSLKSLSEKCGVGVSRRKVQTALRFFENCGFLVKQTSRHNTLITICNWGSYQNVPDSDVTDTDRQPANACHTDVTPMLPKKKEHKEGKAPPFLPIYHSRKWKFNAPAKPPTAQLQSGWRCRIKNTPNTGYI
ncbi:MAG: hypothetical protein ABFR90_04240 [Planctomycetota bacterium]